MQTRMDDGFHEMGRISPDTGREWRRALSAVRPVLRGATLDVPNRARHYYCPRHMLCCARCNYRAWMIDQPHVSLLMELLPFPGNGRLNGTESKKRQAMPQNRV